jgi:serine/threonine protein kinase
VNAIKKLSHPNIVNIIDFLPEATIEKTSGRKINVILIIVEEIAIGGELFYYVSNSGFFSEEYARYFF